MGGRSREPVREVTLHWVAVGIYIVAALLFANAVIFGQAQRMRWARFIAAAGLVPHAAAIIIRWIAAGHGPYILKYEVLSSDAWIAVALLLVFLWRRPTWGALALVVLPGAILAVALGLFSNPSMRELPPSLRSIWLIFHIGFAKISAASFLMSVAAAVVLLLKEAKHAPGWMDRVPEPAALDAYVARFAGFGFLFWTVTVAAGSIWANQSWGRYWGWDVIETWSFIAWLTYGSFLHARLFFKLKSKATAWASIASFAIFVLTILILPFLMPSIHASYFQ
jgi:cytochrome c-type biogenesis protein CcsB